MASQGEVLCGEPDMEVWGKGMRHMRINQLDLDKQKLEAFLIDRAMDKSSQLKVLVLRSLPEQVRYVQLREVSPLQYQHVLTGRNVLRSAPYPYLPFGPTLPKDMADVKERLLAMKIVAQDIPIYA